MAATAAACISRAASRDARACPYPLFLAVALRLVWVRRAAHALYFAFDSSQMKNRKDWRRIATRYDRCAHTFLSAINIAASVAFYLEE